MVLLQSCNILKSIILEYYKIQQVRWNGWQKDWIWEWTEISGGLLLLLHSDKWSRTPAWTLPRICRAGPSLGTCSCPVEEYGQPERGRGKKKKLATANHVQTNTYLRQEGAYLSLVLTKHHHYRILFAFWDDGFQHVLLHICHGKETKQWISHWRTAGASTAALRSRVTSKFWHLFANNQ